MIERVEVGGVEHVVEAVAISSTKGRVYLNSRPIEDHDGISLAAAKDDARLLATALRAATPRQIEHKDHPMTTPPFTQGQRVRRKDYPNLTCIFHGMLPKPDRDGNDCVVWWQDPVYERWSTQNSAKLEPIPEPTPHPIALAAAEEIGRDVVPSYGVRGLDHAKERQQQAAAIIERHIAPEMKVVEAVTSINGPMLLSHFKGMQNNSGVRYGLWLEHAIGLAEAIAKYQLDAINDRHIAPLVKEKP